MTQDEFFFEAAAAVNSTPCGGRRCPGKLSADAGPEKTPQAWGLTTDADVSNSGSWTSAVEAQASLAPGEGPILACRRPLLCSHEALLLLLRMPEG